MTENTGKKSESYDVVVVGGGPAGVSCAWYSAKRGEKVLLIDAHPNIGGCHRVKRSDGKFGEHGPRIYSTSYVCVRRMLDDMGLNFADYFTPYEFGISNIARKNFDQLEFREKLIFARALIFGINGVADISVADFAKAHDFSEETIDYLDRLCRLTDGAGSDRYPIRQLLNIINGQSLYTLLQPSRAMDRGFWPDVRKKLEDRGVKIMTSAIVTGVVVDAKERIARGVTVQDISSVKTLATPWTHVGDIGGKRIDAKKIFMCVPPAALLRILGNRKLKKYFGVNEKWVAETKYEKYINVTFMWVRDVLGGVKRVWGFPATEWGVAFIVLTDTMRGEKFGTIISATPTKLPANFDTDEYTSTEFAAKILEQIRIAYPNLPQPDSISVEVPEPFEDTAYVATAGTFPMPPRGYIKNMFSIGPHNGHGEYTSMESAVSNVMHFFGETRPELWRVRHILLILLVIIGAIAGYFMWKRKNS